MKITQAQLDSLCDAIMASGSRLASAGLTVERVRKAVESGHPAITGQKFDTPKQAAIESAISAAVLRYASKLTVDGSQAVVVSDNLRTATRKGSDTVCVVRTVRSDLGEAKPAVGWLHRLRSYIAAIRRDGERAVSVKTRRGLVAEFNKLSQPDFRCLNVSNDSTGFGLTRGKAIIANMGQAEGEAVADFKARMAAMSDDSALAKAKAKAKANGKGKAKRKGKTRGAYRVVVNDDKSVSVLEVASKGNGSKFTPSPEVAAKMGKAEAVPV